jgi:hypothetical protein
MMMLDAGGETRLRRQHMLLVRHSHRKEKVMTPGFGNDGGFWMIVNGKLIRVPPWNPEIAQDIGLATKLADHAFLYYKDSALGKSMVELAQTIANQHVKAISEQLAALSE